VPELIADQTRYKAAAEIAALDYKRVTEAQKEGSPRSHRRAISGPAKANPTRQGKFGTAGNVARFRQKSPRRSREVLSYEAHDPCIHSARLRAAPRRTRALFTLMDFSKVRVPSGRAGERSAVIKGACPQESPWKNCPANRSRETSRFATQRSTMQSRTMLTE